MPVPAKFLPVIRQWVEKAENDLKNAAYCLTMPSDCPTDTVCYHTQQCVEKYLKALLVAQDVDFPKTHDIGALILHLLPETRPDLSVEVQRRLTDYATTVRYPGDYEPVPLNEARKAVAIARRVRRKVRSLLPTEVLKTGK